MLELAVDGKRGRWRIVVAFATAMLTAAPARADGFAVHWDASAQVGVMKRFLSSGPDEAGFGPAGQLTGHVALLPLVHVGGYFGHDISPLAEPADASARDLTFGGLRLKGMIPGIRGNVRAWIFGGFGYAGVYARSWRSTLRLADGSGNLTPTRARVEGAGGGFFEVPFGIGASYKFFKPWELCAELGARAAFGHSGSAYEAPGPQVTVVGDPATGAGFGQNRAPSGVDRFALGLTVGVLVDL